MRKEEHVEFTSLMASDTAAKELLFLAKNRLNQVADADTAVANAKKALSKTTDETAALEARIKALDISVAEATEVRKKEHVEFTSLLVSDTAAKELLFLAENRLNQFYNTALYKPPPKSELSEEDRIVVNEGGTAPVTAA